ncbi:MAG: nitrilase-related carbon-nitrogen hydrolase, partial [Xanthomonadales bacterium]|nr:nitrilase-related carbon-nitrogen hydrolase [Xanthomonadales bacterium]
MSRLRTVLLQADLAWANPAANRRKMEVLLSDHAHDADLVVLPETFTTGFTGDLNAAAESMDGESVQWMRD